MATLTFNNPTAPATAKAERTLKTDRATKTPGIFSRIVTAMQQSRQRQAEIEIRRMRAIIGDRATRFDDALLPFRGE